MRVNFFQLVTLVLGFAGSIPAAPTPEVAKNAAAILKRPNPNFGLWDKNWSDPETSTINLARARIAFEDVDSIVGNYFQPGDKPHVEAVFKEIAGATEDDRDGEPQGSSYFGRIVIINTRFDHQGDDCEDKPNMLAWLDTIEKCEPNRAVMRIRLRAFEYPLDRESQCKDLDQEVSGKMSTLGGVILHEFTHFFPIGKANVGTQITDYGEENYGPVTTRRFNNPSNVPVTNADQYRWFAQEYWWTVICEHYFLEARNNRDWLLCQDENHCIVMQSVQTPFSYPTLFLPLNLA